MPFRRGGGGSGTPISSISSACFGGCSASRAAASRKLIGAAFVTPRDTGCTGVRAAAERGACCAASVETTATVTKKERMRFILVPFSFEEDPFRTPSRGTHRVPAYRGVFEPFCCYLELDDEV